MRSEVRREVGATTGTGRNGLSNGEGVGMKSPKHVRTLLCIVATH
jgi:hypothetical protein